MRGTHIEYTRWVELLIHHQHHHHIIVTPPANLSAASIFQTERDVTSNDEP
jgi:hypothetical protein